MANPIKFLIYTAVFILIVILLIVYQCVYRLRDLNSWILLIQMIGVTILVFQSWAASKSGELFPRIFDLLRDITKRRDAIEQISNIMENEKASIAFVSVIIYTAVFVWGIQVGYSFLLVGFFLQYLI